MSKAVKASPVFCQIAEGHDGMLGEFEGALRMITNHLQALPKSRGVQYFLPLDKPLRKFCPEFRSPTSIIEALESNWDDFSDHLTVVTLMSGLKQIAKNTILPKLAEAFGLNTEDAKNSVGFLVSLGFSEDSASCCVAHSKFRNLGVELYFYAVCLALVTWGNAKSPAAEAAAEDLSVSTDPLAPAVLLNKIDTLSRQVELLMAHLQKGSTPPVQSQPIVGARAKSIHVPYSIDKDASDSDSDEASDSDLSEGTIRAMATKEEIFRAGVRAVQGPLTGEQSVNPLFAFQPTSREPTADFLAGDLLTLALIRERSDFNLATEVGPDLVLLKLFESAEGLIIPSLDGVITHIVGPKHKSHQVFASKTITLLYKPDNHPSLAQLGASQVPSNLYPSSPKQLDECLYSQSFKVANGSPLFPGVPAAVLQHNVSQFRRKILQLVDTVFGGRTDACVQANTQWVTKWSTILLFYLNQWIKATLHGDIALLLRDFDAKWQSYYHPMLACDSTGRPQFSLRTACYLVMIRCAICKRPGEAAFFCSSDSCRATMAKSTSTASDGSDKYMKTYNEWKKTMKDSADKSHDAFALSEIYKSKNFSSAVTPAAAKFSGDVQVFAREQHRIKMEPCLNVTYN